MCFLISKQVYDFFFLKKHPFKIFPWHSSLHYRCIHSKINLSNLFSWQVFFSNTFLCGTEKRKKIIVWSLNSWIIFIVLLLCVRHSTKSFAHPFLSIPANVCEISLLISILLLSTEVQRIWVMWPKVTQLRIVLGWFDFKILDLKHDINYRSLPVFPKKQQLLPTSNMLGPNM